MALLFLVRHGLTAQTGHRLYGRTPGIDLDARGRAQAEQLITRFEGVRLTAVYSSPLERCVQTVAPLADARRLQIRPEAGLIEMAAGDWTGRTLVQLRRAAAWRTVQRTPSAFAFPGGGESFVDAQARALDAVQRIARRHRRGAVLLATHGDIVRIVLAHLLGTPLDDFQRLVIDAVGVSAVLFGTERPHVLLVNDTDGLSRFRADQTAPWESGPAHRRKVRG